jgi:hypothetical protein
MNHTARPNIITAKIQEKTIKGFAIVMPSIRNKAPRNNKPAPIRFDTFFIKTRYPFFPIPLESWADCDLPEFMAFCASLYFKSDRRVMEGLRLRLTSKSKTPGLNELFLEL